MKNYIDEEKGLTQFEWNSKVTSPSKDLLTTTQINTNAAEGST